MKLKKIITCFCLISITLLKAQTVKYECSPPIVDDKMWYIKQVFAKDGNNVYVLNMGGEISQIECFNSETLEPVYKKTVNVPYLKTTQAIGYNPKDFFPDHNMFYNNGKIVFLSAWFNKKEKTNNVLGQSFIAKDGAENGQMTTIMTDFIDKKREKENKKSENGLKDSQENSREKARAKNVFVWGNGSAMVASSVKPDKNKNADDGYPNYIFQQSANGANILIIKHYDAERIFYYKVVDFDLKEIDSGEINIEGDIFSSATNFIYDGNGNIFFLLSAENDKSKWLGKTVTYESKLFSYNQKNNSQTEYNLGSTDNTITNIMYKLAGNTIVVAGFYAIGSERNGFFYNVIDKNSGKAISSKESILEAVLPEQGIKLEIMDVALKANGGAYILSEERNVTTWISSHTHTYGGGASGGKEVTSAGSGTHHAAIFFGNIFIVNIGKDNSLVWERKIEKSQKINFDNGYASFAYWLNGESVFCAHNEINQASVNILMPPSLKGITINSFNAAGDKQSSVIGGDELDKLGAKINFSFMDTNKLYTIGRKGKSNVLIKIK